jgi:ABC-2 type transport system permease protein
MFAATFYIMWCSGKNRLRRRLRRLREPRYLIGATVGFAYLFFAFFGRFRARPFASGRSGRGPSPGSVLATFGATAPALAGLLLLLTAAASWLMPFSSGLLEFTQAETTFLFPAPISRRQLLFYRLVRSQWAVFFGALIMAMTYPVASIPARIRGLLAMWLLLMTSRVFFTGVTLARARLRTGPVGARRVAWVPLLMTFGAVAAIAGSIAQRIWQRPVVSLGQAFSLLVEVSLTGLPHLVLLPFIALVRPLFADSLVEFLRVLPAAIGVYAVSIVWVLRADETFDVMTGDLAEAHVQRPTKRTTAYQARTVGWTLALTGRPETAFVWKGVLQTFRIVDRRVLFRLFFILLWLTATVAAIGRARGLAQGLGLFAAFGAVFVALMGPQILRLDLRQDLQHLELMKTWPVRPAVVVRGELAWPAAVITGIAWTLGTIGLFLSAAAFTRTAVAWRIAPGVAGMILVPALVLAQYAIHNATALMFPAWIPLGGGRPRGVDAMGQRLIMLGATWFLLILAVAPGVLIGGILWLAFHRVLGPWILIPGAAICTGIVALEVLAATEALGPAYERLDLTSVERGE